MAAKKKKPAPSKSVNVSLGYDSYSFANETVRCECPPVAQLELRDRVTKAKRKGLEIIDRTPVPDFRHATLSQLEWHEGFVRRAWFTSSAKVRASEVARRALEKPEFSKLEEIGIGLENWEGSNQKHLDEFFDVLDAAGVHLSGFAYGDYVNSSGVIIQADSLERLGARSPALSRLRVTTTRPTRLDGVKGGSLEALWLRSLHGGREMLEQLDRAWPQLTSLGIGWHRLSGAERLTDWAWLIEGQRMPRLRHLTLIGSTIWSQLLPALQHSGVLAKLETLDLRTKAEPDRELSAALHENAAHLSHLKALVLPEPMYITALETAGVTLEYCADRTQFAHRD